MIVRIYSVVVHLERLGEHFATQNYIAIGTSEKDAEQRVRPYAAGSAVQMGASIGLIEARPHDPPDLMPVGTENAQ